MKYREILDWIADFSGTVNCVKEIKITFRLNDLAIFINSLLCLTSLRGQKLRNWIVFSDIFPIRRYRCKIPSGMWCWRTLWEFIFIWSGENMFQAKIFQLPDSLSLSHSNQSYYPAKGYLFWHNAFRSFIILSLTLCLVLIYSYPVLGGFGTDFFFDRFMKS